MSLTTEQMRVLHRNLFRAVTLDKMMMRLIRVGKLVGFYHEGGIALAPGVAAGTFLQQHDIMWPHYRAHGIAHLISKGIDIKRFIAEHMGREDGCCKGRLRAGIFGRRFYLPRARSRKCGANSALLHATFHRTTLLRCLEAGVALAIVCALSAGGVGGVHL